MKAILTKLKDITGKVGYIQKDKKNSAQGYSYLSEAGIKAVVQPLLVEHGVMFSVNVQSSVVTEIGQTKSGTPQFRTDILLSYRFMDTDSGEMLEGAMAGSGVDTGDKGVFKAITGAIKYALTSTFLVPTGDDAEVESHEASTKSSQQPKIATQIVEKMTDAQRDEIDELSQTLGETKANIIKRCREVYGISITELSTVQASGVIAGLKKRLESKQ